MTPPPPQEHNQEPEGESSREQGDPSPPSLPCLTQHTAKPIVDPTGTTLMTGTQHQLPGAQH